MSDDSLQNRAHCDVMFSNERRVIDVGEESHEELTIESIRQSTVSWNGVAKIFDVECSLETRRKKTSKGCNQRGKGGHDEGVELEGSVLDRGDVEGRG